MSFDYIEITKSLSKDKPCLDYLEREAFYTSSGWVKYYHEGCKALQVWLQPDYGQLKIKGSFPYFIAGQNFRTGIEDFKNGVDYLASILEVNLYEAEAKAFEYGTTLRPLFSPSLVIDSHLKIKGMKTWPYPNGKYFEDKGLIMKLYDAGKNMKQKLSGQERKRLEMSFGYDPKGHYLRIENHYKKPEACFKQGPVYVSDMLEEGFQILCKEDLLNKYQAIMKTSQTTLSSKKQLTSSTIPLLILKEYEKLLPGKVEDLIKQKIKSIPADILSKEDKKSRARQIKANLGKVQVADKCRYDVSELLSRELFKSLANQEAPISYK